MKLISFALLFLVLALPSSAQTARQSYPLTPFVCPTGQFVYGFNPATHGLPGWFCASAQAIGVCPAISTTGTFTCATVTVDPSTGCVSSVVSGSCGGGPPLGGTLALYSGGDLGLYSGGSLGLY